MYVPDWGLFKLKSENFHHEGHGGKKEKTSKEWLTLQA